MDNCVTGRKLCIYYQNVRGLRSKTTTFSRNLSLHSYDVIVLTETWLIDSIADAELFDNRYVVCRRDRDYAHTGQGRGGGVLVAARKDLFVTPQSQFCSSAEDIWISIALKSKNVKTPIKLHLCSLYLCSQNLGYSFSQQLSNFFNKLDQNILINNPLDKYLIIGDFNLSSVIWLPNDENAFSPTNYCTSDELLLIDELSTHNFRQYNGVLNKFGRILDLVLSSEYNISVSECDDPLVPIDPHHSALTIVLPLLNFDRLKMAPSIVYSYGKGDYDSINNEILDIDWTTTFSGMSLDDSTSFFYRTFNNLRDKHVPCKMVSHSLFPKWYSQSLIKAIKEKRKFERKYKNYKNRCDLESYIILRKRVKKIESLCYQKYISSVEDSIQKNPKTFWSHIKSTRNSNGIPGVMNYGSDVVNSGESICNAFSDYFQSTFLHPDSPSANSQSTLLPSSVNSPDPAADISSVEIDITVVRELLLKLDPSKSAGPDHIPALFLINCAKTISLPISLLFKKSLSVCTVPNVWKSAFVTPVHKKGLKTDILNYRPISKLCLISKVFEKIVYNQIYATLKNSFSDFQHGFLRGRSTVSNLVLLNDNLTATMDKGRQVDVIYTDYSKAFDRINYKLLLIKLQNIGIRGDLLRWFSSYISNRSQAVVISNYISSWVSIPSGVPQGSLLGPLLFVIFVNDINSCLHASSLLCFADDMKVFSAISSQEDVDALQADLSRLDDYCCLNQLDLNPSKCFSVTFSRKKDILQSSYTLKGHALERKTHVKDLGVMHDTKLLFDSHVDSVATKAYRALGFVMRSSVGFARAKTLKILYCTFVRSHLEYASQVWNPNYQVYITRLENVQRKFLKFLCYRLKDTFHSSDYLNVCKKHHLLPLELRREIADITYLLKIASAKIDCPQLLSELSLKVPQKNFRSNPTICLPKVNTNYRQNSYLWRACNKFNLLSKHFELDLFCTSVPSARRMLSERFFEPT